MQILFKVLPLTALIALLLYAQLLPAQVRLLPDRIGIGLTSPARPLHVNGISRFDGRIETSFGANNVALGTGAGLNATGNYNTFLGAEAGRNTTTGNSNTATGRAALYSNVAGFQNTATGYHSLYFNTANNSTAHGALALFSNTSGPQNTAVGAEALYANTTGGNNTATGYYSLRFNTSGTGNAAFGNEALRNNTMGAHNTAQGRRALYSNTTGYSNVAIGASALYSNTDRSNLVAVGDSALYNNGVDAPGSDHAVKNTAVGSKALFSNTRGSNNTAIGAGALYHNTSKRNLVAIGYGALYNNGLGAEPGFEAESNTAVGYEALTSNTIGAFNTGIGYGVLANNVSGFFNTALGNLALYSNTSGDNNTAVGYSSMSSDAGNGNTSIGYISGINMGDATSRCTYVGYAAGHDSEISFTNSTALGNESRISADNQVRIGNTSITSIGGYQPWTDLSDGRFKRRLQENVPGLEFILKLRPVTYHVDVHGLAAHLQEDRMPASGSDARTAAETPQKPDRQAQKSRDEKSKVNHTGFVAQEVEKAARSIGYDFNGVDKPQSNEGLYGLRYSVFVVPLVKAVQEQQQQLEEKDTRIAALEKENKELETRLARLERLVLSSSPEGAAGNIQSQSATLSSARLDQNHPNPFSANTTIRYFIPQAVAQAELRITDAAGRLLKTIPVDGRGAGQTVLQAHSLSASAYAYSLVIDGQIIETRQMVLTR